MLTANELLTSSGLSEVLDAIDHDLEASTVVENSPLALRHQRCHAVKVLKHAAERNITNILQSGRNGMLDIARRIYKESVDACVSLSTEYAGTSNIEQA